MASIVLVDDHPIHRAGLAILLQSFGYNVPFEASNGIEFQEKLKENILPDIVLMDINMPQMDGFETTRWLKKYHPSVKVLVLSMYDSESAIIRMLRCGARGYILKDSEPSELRCAIYALINKGFYYSDLVNGKLMHAINEMEDIGTNANNFIQLSEKEISFLKYCCSELTYKEIADKMNLSHRTIDGYRDNLFERLNLKTRVGLVMYAIKNSIVIFM